MFIKLGKVCKETKRTLKGHKVVVYACIISKIIVNIGEEVGLVSTLLTQVQFFSHAMLFGDGYDYM
jgi:hypothetical protein